MLKLGLETKPPSVTSGFVLYFDKSILWHALLKTNFPQDTSI